MAENKTFLKKAREAFIRELEKILSTKKKPTILVCGYMGVGKTSLIQSVLGDSIVSDNNIVHGKPGTLNFQEYEDEFIRLFDSRGFEPGMTEGEYIKSMESFVKKRQKYTDIDNHIHLIWYCISGANARVTASDIKLIKKVFPYENVQVVITKSDITRQKQKEAIIDELIKNNVSRNKITFVSDGEKDKGVQELVKKSLSVIPKAYQNAFIAKQQVELDYKRESANQVINQTAIRSGLWGIVPFADLIIILPQQMKMVAAIANVYGFDVSLATRIAGSTGLATAVASALTTVTMLDTIPVWGQIISAVTVGGVTKALGHLVNDYFYECNEFIIKGGNVEDIKPLNGERISIYLKKYF